MSIEAVGAIHDYLSRKEAGASVAEIKEKIRLFVMEREERDRHFIGGCIRNPRTLRPTHKRTSYVREGRILESKKVE